jgi:hypothetical protein
MSKCFKWRVLILPRPTYLLEVSEKVWQIPVAARSKAYAFGRALAGIAGSNPTGGMGVCLLYSVCVSSGRGLCDRLVTLPEESYRVWRVSECDLEASKRRRPRPDLGCAAGRETEKV